MRSRGLPNARTKFLTEESQRMRMWMVGIGMGKLLVISFGLDKEMRRRRLWLDSGFKYFIMPIWISGAGGSMTRRIPRVFLLQLHDVRTVSNPVFVDLFS